MRVTLIKKILYIGNNFGGVFLFAAYIESRFNAIIVSCRMVCLLVEYCSIMLIQRLLSLLNSVMLHYRKRFYFSFVSNSLRVRDKEAVCDYVRVYMKKKDLMFHGFFICFRDLSNNRIGCLTPEMFVGLNSLHKL